MSDNYLRLIPTDPTWRPAGERAQRAVTALFKVVPRADSVQTRLYDEVTFIDQGANFDRLSCPVSRADLSTTWWSEQMEHASGSGFNDLDVTTPCCSNATSLNDLIYDWPAGFASAELSVANPGRSWLEESELETVAVQLGHALKQAMAHY